MSIQPAVTVDTPSPSLDDMKAAIRANRDRIAEDLAAKRGQRDDLNDSIRVLVAQLADADRLVGALEPRKRKATA